MSMKNLGKFISLLTVLLLVSAMPCFAAQNQSDLDKQLKLADDITKETIVGPGSVQVTTGKDILMSFGATARIIPTSESDWDFGVADSDAVKSGGLMYGALVGDFFRSHGNESGTVQDSYIRTEAKMYFNAMPKDRAWSFYAALEFDRPIDTASVDSRGGKSNDSSNFGLERLHLTYALPMNMRLHAGWDIWHMDAFEGAAMVYGDDNPGFWITGENDTVSYNVGYFKLMENDFQNSPVDMQDGANNDRDLYAGYVAWQMNDAHKFQFLAAYDRIRDVVANDLAGAMGSPFGVVGDAPDTDSYHAGAYWVGKFGALEIFTEAVYQFGSADNTGLGSTVGPDRATVLEEDYDINAYALAGDISYEFKGKLTDYPLKPHLGFMYTSGDDDPYDDKLEGYNGVDNAQRFSSRWGGENTIIGDTNLMLGTALYGYIPEFYGNGTPVTTGGLQNFAGNGNGRGDNPGLTLISAGITVAPKRFLIFKTNINNFWWNEDIYVTNMVDPVDATVNGAHKVDAGYVGTEWDNELTLATSKHSFIKAQAAFFFPGEVIEDLTEALTGESSDEMAMRLAAEFIINF
ncbi:autotransporter outer membrane beta-barrel domain-containing protein [Desulfocicer vacuolatum]|nr:autotransporter outer membrane beta-barrel domain-containing protein [Desulfocicer vacuolatum]